MMYALSVVGRAVSQSQRNRYYLFIDLCTISDIKSISTIRVTDNKKILIFQFVWWV